MVRPIVFCLLAGLLLISQAQALEFLVPLTGCGSTVTDINGNEIQDSSLVNPMSVAGPISPGNALSFKTPGSSMSIPFPGLIRQISFSILLENNVDNNPILQVTSGGIITLEVKQVEAELSITLNSNSGGLTKLVQFAFEMNVWHTVDVIYNALVVDFFNADTYGNLFVYIDGNKEESTGDDKFDHFADVDDTFSVTSFNGALSGLKASDSQEKVPTDDANNPFQPIECPPEPPEQDPVPILSPNPVPTVDCDSTEPDDCDRVVFEGTGFVEGTTYHCTITEYMIGPNGVRISEPVRTEVAVFVSDTEVHCLVSNGNSAYVKLTSPTHDDAVIGSGKVNVYPQECLNCPDNLEETCVSTGDGCWINQECFEDGEILTQNPTTKCDAVNSPFEAVEVVETPPDVNVTATSCDGSVVQGAGLDINNKVLNMFLTARVPCKTRHPRTIMSTSNGRLAITQDGRTVKVTFKFENELTGDSKYFSLYIDTFTGRSSLLPFRPRRHRRHNRRHNRRRNRRRHNRRHNRSLGHGYGHHGHGNHGHGHHGHGRCHGHGKNCKRRKRQCELSIYLSHNGNTGNGTELKVNDRDSDEDFCNTEDWQLALPDLEFNPCFKKTACVHVNNDDANSFGYEEDIQYCQNFVHDNRKCP